MSFSVLLSVYAKEKPEYFNQAFLSIWDHQTLKPGQVVLVKDGPLTNELNETIEHWKNKLNGHLTLIVLYQNVGLGAALNAGLEACEYELVARMDTDDVSLPVRFEKQVAFMQAHPEIIASSAVLEEWNEDLTKKTGTRCLPQLPSQLATFATKRSPLSHPLAIYRKSAVMAVGGYPPLRNAQDYALWSLLLTNGGKLANLPDTLLRMRTGSDLFARRGWHFFKQEVALFKFQHQIGFISLPKLYWNTFMRAGLRLSPTFIKRLAYKSMR